MGLVSSYCISGNGNGINSVVIVVIIVILVVNVKLEKLQRSFAFVIFVIFEPFGYRRRTTQSHPGRWRSKPGSD